MWVTLKLAVVGTISTKQKKYFYKLCKLELQTDLLREKIYMLEKDLIQKESVLSSTQMIYSVLKIKGEK